MAGKPTAGLELAGSTSRDSSSPMPTTSAPITAPDIAETADDGCGKDGDHGSGTDHRVDRDIQPDEHAAETSKANAYEGRQPADHLGTDAFDIGQLQIVIWD